MKTSVLLLVVTMSLLVFPITALANSETQDPVFVEQEENIEAINSVIDSIFIDSTITTPVNNGSQDFTKIIDLGEGAFPINVDNEVDSFPEFFTSLIEAARRLIGLGAQSVPGTNGLTYTNLNNTITFTAATGVQYARVTYNGLLYTRFVVIGGSSETGVPAHMLK